MNGGYHDAQAKQFVTETMVRDTQVGYWFELKEYPEIDLYNDPDKEPLIIGWKERSPIRALSKHEKTKVISLYQVRSHNNEEYFHKKLVENENTSHLLLWHFIVLSDV
ncbi:hypothetical protein [Acinetobacter baumannii]|uniref:hypothetical protein n=1 Tax=Acinetobacter baumannii TaxID=470 RepID=UPI0037C0C933